MVGFQTAQPALLYIVPCVLGAVAAHAWARGEARHVFGFSEEKSNAEKRAAAEAAEAEPPAVAALAEAEAAPKGEGKKGR
jgi:minor histocompatibility antigen H13